ncbi:hypothetical protein ACB092_11G152100 [Castanea dentata]
MTRGKKAKEVRIFFSKSNQLAYGLITGPEVKAMRERFDAIAADRKFHLEEHSEEEQGKYKIKEQTYSHVHAEAVIGREEDKNAIIGSPLDPNVKENVSVLPIVGIGGLGKTALAQLVFNDEEIKNHFQLKLWVCVSDDFDKKMIVEKILECIKNKKQKDLEMNTLMLVLDDVWNENREKWLRLKDILTGGARGNGILLTTRIKKVAKITKSMQLHLLRGLDDQQSWSLLKKMAFKEGEELKTASFEKIGNEILKKCGGILLAIRAVGGLLYLKKSVREWQLFKDNELLNRSEEDNDILPTLKLTYHYNKNFLLQQKKNLYDHLPSNLKQCFAFCSIFPKDYEIEKVSLIYMWMAQGFIKLYNEKKCPEDVEVEEDELGNISKFKIHDLMHDLAIKLMGLESTTIYLKEKEIDEKTRHVSFGDTLYSSSKIPTSLYRARRIKIFLLLCQPKYTNINSDHSTCSDIFTSFKFIRLLDLHNMGIKTIPSSIKKLKRLRYLDLSDNRDIEMLPNSIVKLYNLQTLKLLRCYTLKELLRDINKLVSLKFLEINGCSDLTHMPNGLGQLTNLQTLSRFVMSKGRIDPVPRSYSELKELNRLNELRGNLSIENLKQVKDALLEWMVVGKGDSLPSFPRLFDLEIVNSPQLTSFPLFPYLEELRLSNCSLKQSLERMMINNKASSRNLPSIASSSSSSSTIVAPLSKLRFMKITNTEEALPEECLRNLISLHTLYLDNCPLPQGMRYLTALQDLYVQNSEVVDLSNDWDGMEWQGLRTLLSLLLHQLPKLVSLPMGLQYVSSLLNLQIWQCPSLIDIPKWICKLVSFQSLEIWDCPNLESLPEGIGALTSLQKLEIRRCPILLKRCKKQIGEDWHKISHIPNLVLYPQEE